MTCPSQVSVSFNGPGGSLGYSLSLDAHLLYDDAYLKKKLNMKYLLNHSSMKHISICMYIYITTYIHTHMYIYLCDIFTIEEHPYCPQDWQDVED